MKRIRSEKGQQKSYRFSDEEKEVYIMKKERGKHRNREIERKKQTGG